MTEIQPQGNESNDEVAKLIPTDMDEAFAVDIARRVLGGMWNPEDPAWKAECVVHDLALEAGLAEPMVDLDEIRSVVADLDKARKAVDDVSKESDNSQNPGHIALEDTNSDVLGHDDNDENYRHPSEDEQ